MHLKGVKRGAPGISITFLYSPQLYTHKNVYIIRMKEALRYNRKLR